MRKQTLAIIGIIGLGSILGTVYASSTVITDSGISTTNLTVTGTCTGCGGGEGSFTNYSILLNQTVSGTFGNVIRLVLVNNTGSILSSDQFNNVTIVKSNGVGVDQGGLSIGNFNQQIQFGQSETGKYRVIYDSNINHLLIYKNDVLMDSYSINVSQFQFGNFQSEALGVSPNGKYIAIYGVDSSASINRMILLEGS